MGVHILIFIYIFILWFIFYIFNKLAKFISAYITNENSTEKEKKRWYFGSWLAFVFILFGDEMIGGVQMGYLCSTLPEGEVFIEKIKKLEGLEVIKRGVNEKQKFTILPVEKYVHLYSDANSGELLARNIFSYYFKGGWLKTNFSFSGRMYDPLLFSGSCRNTDEIYQVIETYNLKVKTVYK